MSPLECAQMASRWNNTCYVIEEEHTEDVETSNCGCTEQCEVNLNNGKNMVLEINGRIRECDNRPDIVDYDSRNVFSDLDNLNESINEDVAIATVYDSRQLSTNHRKLLNTSARDRSASSTIHTVFESTICDKQQHISSVRNLNLKSGNLILIVPQQVHRLQGSSPCTTSTSSHSLRCPVIVKIHCKSYEKYAIISRTRRHQTMPSFFLKLKQSYVTQSLSNPSHFVVIEGGHLGKSFTFEAINPEVAMAWLHAFSSDSSSSFTSSSHQKQSIPNRELSFQRTVHQVSKLEKCSVFSGPKQVGLYTLSKSHSMPVLSESLVENIED